MIELMGKFIVKFDNITVKNVQAEDFFNAILEALDQCWNVSGNGATTEQIKG